MTGEGIAGPGALRLVLGGAAVAVFAWWAVHDGGTAPGSWYPAALLFVAALVPVAYTLEPRRLSRPVVVALAALAAFTAWSFLSIAWADARGDAWDGANLTLLYLTVFALFAALPWTAAEASILLGAFALATAAAGAWAVGAVLLGSGDPAFSDGRLAAPVGYENASEPARLDLALGRAAIAIALSMGVLAAAGLSSSRLDVAGAPRLRTRRRLVAALACVLAVLSLGAGLAVARGGDGAAPAVGSRFAAGVESGRYDFWRVAWHQFSRHPLHGAGADNFAQDYVRERRRREEPLYPHSIMFRTLGQTGIVGVMLLGGFLVAAFASVRWSDPLRRPVAAAALVSATAWLAHASLDWLWELPALAAPAMACLGLVAALGMASGEAKRRGWRPGRAFAVALLAGPAAVSLALPGLAARQIEHAVPRFSGDPAAALRGLAHARELNRLSDRPDVIAGALASRVGDLALARRSLRRALGRDPGNWYTHAQLAVVDLQAGRREAALGELERARRLNPLEPAIGLAVAATRRGEPLPGEVQARLSSLVVPAPLGRRPLTCRPVLGLGDDCSGRPAA